MSLSAPLEGSPTSDQKERLEDFLSELKVICRKYRLLLDTEDGEAQIVDLDRGTTVGIGVTYLVNHNGRITAYDCTGSILDGSWLIDTPSGSQEQRDAGSVWPRRTGP